MYFCKEVGNPKQDWNDINLSSFEKPESQVYLKYNGTGCYSATKIDHEIPLVCMSRKTYNTKKMKVIKKEEKCKKKKKKKRKMASDMKEMLSERVYESPNPVTL